MARTIADLLSEEELARFLADKNMDYSGYVEPTGVAMPERSAMGMTAPVVEPVMVEPQAPVQRFQPGTVTKLAPVKSDEERMARDMEFRAAVNANRQALEDRTKPATDLQGMMNQIMAMAKPGYIGKSNDPAYSSIEYRQGMPIAEIMKTPQYQMLQAMSTMYKQQADIDAQKAQAESARAQAAKYMAEAQAGKESKEDKGLPSTALKMQQSEVDALNAASSISANTNALLNQLETGALNLSLLGNLTSEARQQLGISNQESRNYNSFRRTLEKLRNDSLRLNKGVQTEGDAQRAWNELMGSINDTESVKQRLQEIAALNEQAVDLRKYNIENIRSNFGVPPLDTTKAEVKVSPLQGGSQPKPQLGSAASQIPTGSGNLSPQQVQRLQELRAKYRTGG